MEAARFPWPALGVLLVRDGLVSAEELHRVLTLQGDDRGRRVSSRRLGEALVENGLVTSAQVARLVAEQHELPFVDLDSPDAIVPVGGRVPEELARHHTALPIRVFPDESLLVAIADPTKPSCFDDIRAAAGVPVRFAVAAPEAIEAAIDDAAARGLFQAAVEADAGDAEDAVDDLRGEWPRITDVVLGATPAETSAEHTWPAFGSLLLRDELVTESELDAALAQQRLSSTRRLGEILVARGALTDEHVARVLAEQHELPFVDLPTHELDIEAGRRLATDLARIHVALPISSLPDGSLLVVVADPTSAFSCEELRAALGSPLQFAVATPAAIDEAIELVASAAHADSEHQHEPEPEPESTSPAEGREPERDAGFALDRPPLLLVEADDDWQHELGTETEEAVEPVDDVARDGEVTAEPLFGATEPEEAPAVEIADLSEIDPDVEPEIHVGVEAGAQPEVEVDVEAVDGMPDGEELEPLRATASPFVDAIESALALDASAVHFTPGPDGIVVRARVGETLSELETISRADTEDAANGLVELASRGRLALRAGEREVALRSVALPTVHGGRATFRVVESDRDESSLAELLGGTSAVLTTEALGRPGLFVIGGPAGSGRTTTFYAALHELVGSAAVLTIEDPVERLVPGADQTEVDPGTGLTYAAGLHTILRSDPDAVAVGELLDPDTARLAARASLAGRRVLTTLEAEGVAGTVRRLLDLGVDPEALASALTGVVAQRLLHRFCLDCREAYYATAEELVALGLGVEEGGRRLLGRAHGCVNCDGTGHRGLVAVFEVLPLDDDVRAVVAAGATAGEIEQAAVAAGMQTLRESAVRLCLEGVTTAAEADRVPFHAS
jgi:type II secretory ATPase GspE/PulE/Tfp pilus assembly ATPase PilB-like protein